MIYLFVSAVSTHYVLSNILGQRVGEEVEEGVTKREVEANLPKMKAL